MNNNFKYLIALILLSGCNMGPQVHTLRVGDKCIIPDPPYCATITREWWGFQIKYTSTNIIDPTRGDELFEADIGSGNVGGSYATEHANPCDLFDFTLAGTNWEYQILRKHQSDNYELYSIDSRGDGIPTYRRVWDGTNNVTFHVDLSTNRVEY